MAQFNFDDLLKDLGDELPGAPKEPAAGTQDAERPQSTGPGGMFVRNDPRDTPRPPDLTGGGLGAKIDPNQAAREADAKRIRPNDGVTALYAPPREVHESPTLDLGQVLLQAEVIKPDQLANAIRVMKQTPGKGLATILIEMGVDEADIQQHVAQVNDLPFERIDLDSDGDNAYDLKLFTRLGADFCKGHLLIPLRREERRVVIGTTRPDDVFLLDEVRRQLGVQSIKHVLITAYDVRGVLEANTQEDTEEYDVDNILADVDEDDVELVKEESNDDDYMEEAESSPVVRYVNHIIQTALKEGASDIHIEPGEKKLKVRFRIDGVLFEMMNPPWRMHSALTSRIKIMANLDIAERRLPQDGRIRVTVMGRKLDLRVSTLPTAHGEKTVMRILDNRSIQVTLDQLGFEQDTLTIWKGQISQPHGIILVTGPTGSGKTTTLYASLGQMDTLRLNVSTVEDPVEYNLGGITQTQTHDRIGMTFAKALKSLLRQDPDVVMVGEIRDLETATIAIQAALTGHLVLSTLHTNDAPGSVTRLINIGIEPFLIGAALNGVLAQRLVRRVCENCKFDEPVKEEIAEFLVMHGINAESLPKGKGCHKCRETGYIGRLGLYELLVLDDFLRDAVARNPNVTEFRRTCSERGMITLREDGFRKVAAGQTTVEEVLRVTESTI
ncbi:MAG: GspE/PulE family protein [Phycisphaerales bacterium]